MDLATLALVVSIANGIAALAAKLTALRDW